MTAADEVVITARRPAADTLHSDPVDVSVGPRGSLEVLSRGEVRRLTAGLSHVADLFRACSLAVLNSGSHVDDAALVLAQHSEFAIEVAQRTRGVTLRVSNAPASAFVDGKMIQGIKEHLFAVLRDIVYASANVEAPFSPDRSEEITDGVFQFLRNAGVLLPRQRRDLVVCWGGHAISRAEYDYTKEVGYELGLRGLDICTGCGAGAMKGPMKGAAIGHAKQRVRHGRYLGITEPGIIAAESPNPMVNELVIMPDIEKRLEAFVRLGHAIVVFPGGVGTAEEILFLIGLLMHPNNKDIRLPVVFTGPASAREYFELIQWMVNETLGERASQYFEVILDDPAGVARHVQQATRTVRRSRVKSGDAFYFNWLLHVPANMQQPFEVTHASMRALNLSRELPDWELAANLRRAFSGIVTGNVKAHGTRQIREHGPFELQADSHVSRVLDQVLRAFIDQGRMKVAADDYEPCFRVA